MKKILTFLSMIICCSLLFSLGSGEVSFFEERNYYGVVADISNKDIAVAGVNLSLEKFYPYVQIDVLEITNYFETESLILSAINSSYDGLVSMGKGNTILKDLSYEYPEKYFAILTESISSTLPGNINEYCIDLYDTSYLCGIAASSLSSYSKIGVISHNDSVYNNRGVEGFLDGVKEVGPNCNVVLYILDDGTSSETIRAIADSLYTEGVDIIFTLLGDDTIEVVEKAKEQERYVISGDTYFNQDDAVLLSVKTYKEKVLPIIIGDFREKEVSGISIPLGLKDGVVELSWYIDPINLDVLTEDIITRLIETKSSVRRYRTEIINGSQNL